MLIHVVGQIVHYCAQGIPMLEPFQWLSVSHALGHWVVCVRLVPRQLDSALQTTL